VPDGVGLHQRDDHEAAAIGERPDLERDPAEGQQNATTDRGANADEQRDGHDGANAGAATGAAPRHQLDAAAGQEDQHQPGAEGRGRGRTGGKVEQPANPAGALRADPAGRDQIPACLDGDRGDGCARTGAGALHPSGRRSGEQQRG